MQLDKILSKALAICDESNQGGDIFLIAHELFIRLTAQGERPYSEFERWHPFAFTYLYLNNIVDQVSDTRMIHHEFKGVNVDPMFTGTFKKLSSLGISKISHINSCVELNSLLKTHRETTSLNSSYVQHVDAYMNSPIFNEADLFNWSSFKFTFTNLSIYR